MAASQLFIVFALIASVFGDYQFTKPAGGTILTDTSFVVGWIDGLAPALSDTVDWALSLCTGGDTFDTIYEVQTLSAGDGGPPDSGGSLAIDVDPMMGANVQNAYFMCMLWQTTDSDITNYSERFTLSAMTGTFSSDITKSLNGIHDTSAPSRNYTGPSLTASSTASSTPPSTASATSTSPSNKAGSSSILSAAAGAGIGIGGILVLIAIVAVIILLLRRKRRRQARLNPRTSKMMSPGEIQHLDGVPVNWIAKPPLFANSYELQSTVEKPQANSGHHSSQNQQKQQQHQYQQERPTAALAYAYEIPSRRSRAYELGN